MIPFTVHFGSASFVHVILSAAKLFIDGNAVSEMIRILFKAVTCYFIHTSQTFGKRKEGKSNDRGRKCDLHELNGRFLYKSIVSNITRTDEQFILSLR